AGPLLRRAGAPPRRRAARRQGQEAPMKPGRAVGILGYGAYVPRFRIRTRDIAAVWRATGGAAPPVAEKSVPGPDEDVGTMASEAGRTALPRAAADRASAGAARGG